MLFFSQLQEHAHFPNLQGNNLLFTINSCKQNPM